MDLKPNEKIIIIYGYESEPANIIEECMSIAEAENRIAYILANDLYEIENVIKGSDLEWNHIKGVNMYKLEECNE